MKAAPWISAIIGVCTLVGIFYGLASKGGWIITRVEAQAIAQQSVSEEAAARERGHLELQRDLKLNQLRFLSNKAEPTADEELEMELLRDDIRRISERLAEL